ncbi:MAG: DUF5320 domain-containing protein [Thermoleophilia bacterium]|nr:DUF5320 domain-containing protein [Thermoleophilia bacterium]
MPRHDGTGPEGKGPGTGRMLGNCVVYAADFFRNLRRRPLRPLRRLREPPADSNRQRNRE